MVQYLNDAMKRVNYIANETDAAYHEAALRLGLSDSALIILYVLCNAGGSCGLQEIAQLSGVSKQTINSAMRRLEEQGTVALSPLDGKKKCVCLTGAGKALAAKTAMRLIAIENEILGEWNEEERRQYVELQRRYLIAFRQKSKALGRLPHEKGDK